MTPQERQLVDELFERLARLERTPRDAEAERTIAGGLSRAPNAVYALVQTVLVQDEALKRADERIRELSGEEPEQQSGGFLDTMRNALTGGGGRGSVPSVRAGAGGGPDGRWNTGGALASASPAAQAAPGAQGAAPGQGGSFLGTAAASAAGMVGGALLYSSISSLLGGGKSAAGGEQSAAASPWGASGDNAAGSDLARDAGAGQIGDNGQVDYAALDDADFDSDFDGDFGDVG